MYTNMKRGAGNLSFTWLWSRPITQKKAFFWSSCLLSTIRANSFFFFLVGFLPHGIAEQMQQNASQKTNCQCVQLHSRTQAYNNCLFCLVHYLEWSLDAVTTPEYTQSTPGLCSWVPTSVSKNSWFQFWLVRTGSKPRLDFQNGNYPLTSASKLWNFLLKQQTGFQELFSWLTDLCRERERERLNNCATNQPLCSLLGVNHCYLENLHARMYASKEDSVSSSALDHNAGAVTCVQAFVSGQEGHLVSVTKYWMQFL
jgi:hypothetical protein